jgi:probable HAF family extracellular repeat protein
MVDLGTLPGMTYSQGLAINDVGQVVGYSGNSGTDTTRHAFLYNGTPGSGGAMADLGTLGGTYSVGRSINTSGQVAGCSKTTGGAQRAFLYTGTPGVDGHMIDLDAWLDANNPTEGAKWTLASAAGVNDSGLITGEGYYNDGPGGLTDGTRAFLLDASALVSTLLPGDYNHNGVVDAVDYVVWRKNLGSGTSLPNDDTPGVGQDDYTRWRARFGQTTGSGSGASANVAVPEPAISVLLIFGVAGWCLGRRRTA